MLYTISGVNSILSCFSYVFFKITHFSSPNVIKFKHLLGKFPNLFSNITKLNP